VFPGASFSDLWQPSVFAVSIICQALFLWVISPAGRRHFPDSAPLSLRKKLLFLSGLWVLYLAFGTPIDWLSDNYLFSVHMVQHLLETIVMVPLLLAGSPDWLWRPLWRSRALRPVMRVMGHPVTALIFFNVVFGIFHLPSVYSLTLESESFHFFEHSLFFIAALSLWWPILSPLPELPRLQPGMRVLYAVAAMDLSQPLNFALFMTSTAWYGPYIAARRIFHLSPLADQQIGAVIMAVGFFIALVAIVVAALRRYDPSYWYE
jgi:putative membrane protein